MPQVADGVGVAEVGEIWSIMSLMLLLLLPPINIPIGFKSNLMKIYTQPSGG